MNHQFTRCEFLQTTSGIAVEAVVELAAPQSLNTAVCGNAKKEPHAMVSLREKGKRQCRRIIYNNDGCDVMEEDAGTPEGFLSKRFEPILNTQVDSVFYCTGATTMFSHLAKVGETYGEFISDSSEPMAIYARDNIRALKKAGYDTLQLVIEFCHKNNLELFFSHRINDIHDTFLDWERSVNIPSTCWARVKKRLRQGALIRPNIGGLPLILSIPRCATIFTAFWKTFVSGMKLTVWR
jgi:hypothetical protein